MASKAPRSLQSKHYNYKHIALYCALIALTAATILPVVFSYAFPPADPEGRLSVWWFAPFFSGGGYCSEALSFAMLLATTPNISLHIEQHGDLLNYAFYQGLPRDQVQLLLATFKNKTPSDIAICHSEPGAWDPPLYDPGAQCPPPNAKYRIGRTMFETDRIPSGWVERCNRMDEIWVPTHFHVETFSKSGVSLDKLKVIPEPVDVDFFDRAKATPFPLPLPPRFSSRSRVFRFLSIFKWEERKAWRILFRAFLEEFRADEPVVLTILTKPFHTGRGEMWAQVREYVNDVLHLNWTVPEHSLKGGASDWLELNGLPLPPSPPHLPVIQTFTHQLSTAQLRDLYAAADAFVIPSRGEGWGRPHIEAMAMGLPVIATNWSGNTHFMNEDNSYLIRVAELVEIPDGPFKGHRWAEPDVMHLRALMRHVMTSQQEAKQKGAKARHDVSELYSPQQLRIILLERLMQIRDKLQNT